MVFRSSKRNENTSDSETGVATSRVANRTTADSTSASGGWSRKATLEETEAHFGMTVPDKDTMFRLQRLEAMNTTERVRGWVEEGMTIEDMGNPLKMDAFRERQAERPPEVPTTIERQNSRSVQRSEKAASETGPAGETSVPDPVRDVLSSTGRSLDASVQRAMEDRMGDSLGDVQIHTGPQAAAACESINARAFTVGNHVAFNTGEYDPSSPEGQHVIAHELAHVRQQPGGAVSMLPQEDVELEIDPDPQLERDAEETAQRVMQGGELGIQRLENTEVHIQRYAGTIDRESTYLSGNRADSSGSSESLIEKVDAGTADAPSPSVSAADLGSENITEFQKAVIEDIQTLYQKVEQQGVLSKMSDAGTGEALKLGMTEAGKQAGIPFGKIIGSLSGAALQAIYNNRTKVLEFLGLKSESIVDGESDYGSATVGKSRGE